MKISRGASHSLKQAQGKMDSKSLTESKDGKKSDSLANTSLSAQVSLSKQAQQIKQATDIAKDDSVNEKKIAMLQSMIDSGKYQVDSAAVADKLVDEHMKMPT